VQGVPGPGFTGAGTQPPAPITVTGTQTTVTGFGPVPPVQGVPGPGFTGTGTLQPAVITATGAPMPQAIAATHVLVVQEPPRERPVTSGDHPVGQPYTLEFIEPGIQNHRVEVYRSKDAQQVTYRDSHPLDQGGFHLRVLGLRKPAYID